MTGLYGSVLNSTVSNRANVVRSVEIGCHGGKNGDMSQEKSMTNAGQI